MQAIVGANFFCRRDQFTRGSFGHFFESCKKLKSKMLDKIRVCGHLRSAKIVDLNKGHSAKADGKRRVTALLIAILVLWYLTLLRESLGEFRDAIQPVVRRAHKIPDGLAALIRSTSACIASLRSAPSGIGLPDISRLGSRCNFDKTLAIPKICRNFKNPRLARRRDYASYALATGAEWADITPHFCDEAAGDAQIEAGAISEPEALADSDLKIACNARPNPRSRRFARKNELSGAAPRYLRAGESPAANEPRATPSAPKPVFGESGSLTLVDPCEIAPIAPCFRSLTRAADRKADGPGDFQRAVDFTQIRRGPAPLLCGGGKFSLVMAEVGSDQSPVAHSHVDTSGTGPNAAPAPLKLQIDPALAQSDVHQLCICIAFLPEETANAIKNKRGSSGQILKVKRGAQNSRIRDFFRSTLKAISGVDRASRDAGGAKARPHKPPLSSESDFLKSRVALLKSQLATAIKLQNFWAKRAVEIRFAISGLQWACEIAERVENPCDIAD